MATSKKSCLVLLMLTVIMGSSVFPACTTGKAGFHLKDWRVVDASGRAALRLKFRATETVVFWLTDPDGAEVHGLFVSEGTTATLSLAPDGETPKPGQYKLSIFEVDQFGDEEIIGTETFTFKGARVSISEVWLAWIYSEYDGYGSFSLQGVSLKVTNSGDLPAYIYEGRVILNGSRSTFPFVSSEAGYSLTLMATARHVSEAKWGIVITSPQVEAILPGQEKTFNKLVGITGITPGDKAFTLRLKDAAGQVIASYSATVTPSVMS